MQKRYKCILGARESQVDLDAVQRVLDSARRNDQLEFGLRREDGEVRVHFDGMLDEVDLDALRDAARELEACGLDWAIMDEADKVVDSCRMRRLQETSTEPGAVIRGDEGRLAHEWYEKGLRHQQEGEYLSALNAFTQALKYHPDYAEAWYERGRCFHLLDQDDEAIEDMKEAARQGHGDAHKELDLNVYRYEGGGEDAPEPAANRLTLAKEARDRREVASAAESGQEPTTVFRAEPVDVAQAMHNLVMDTPGREHRPVIDKERYEQAVAEQGVSTAAEPHPCDLPESSVIPGTGPGQEELGESAAQAETPGEDETHGETVAETEAEAPSLADRIEKWDPTSVKGTDADEDGKAAQFDESRRGSLLMNYLQEGELQSRLFAKLSYANFMLTVIALLLAALATLYALDLLEILPLLGIETGEPTP